MSEASPLRCPVCHLPLFEDEGGQQLRCHHNHSFDRARQGYWNLLLPQRKRSKAPGDNRDMVLARQRFLNTGAYQPLAQAITHLLQANLPAATELRLLDLGCGEGYYTQLMQQALSAQAPQIQCFGIDISKEAIRCACQRERGITWLVATGADIPLQADSIDVATLIFARLLPEATARVVRSGGLFLVAWAGKDHLRTLRELIYTDVRDSDLNPDAQMLTLFDKVEEQRVQFPFQIDGGEALSDLLMMTPHGQRLRAEKREALLALKHLSLQADVHLSLYRKR